MPRYIDADLLMKELGIADTCEKCQFGCGAFCTKESDFVDACDAICEAPTADVVEVVRCKDCKHYWKNLTIQEQCEDCPVACLVSPSDDAFCSEGEVKK